MQVCSQYGFIVIPSLFYQYAPPGQTHPVAPLPSELVVRGFQPPDQSLSGFYRCYVRIFMNKKSVHI